MRQEIKRALVTLMLAAWTMLAATASGQTEEEGIWIDLRDPAQYRQGHIEGAINIPRGEIGHRIHDHVSDLYMPVHLYGDNNAFVGIALMMLMELGFQSVINEGSYQAILERQGE